MRTQLVVMSSQQIKSHQSRGKMLGKNETVAGPPSYFNENLHRSCRHRKLAQTRPTAYGPMRRTVVHM